MLDPFWAELEFLEFLELCLKLADHQTRLSFTQLCSIKYLGCGSEGRETLSPMNVWRDFEAM